MKDIEKDEEPKANKFISEILELRKKSKDSDLSGMKTHPGENELDLDYDPSKFQLTPDELRINSIDFINKYFSPYSPPAQGKTYYFLDRLLKSREKVYQLFLEESLSEHHNVFAADDVSLMMMVDSIPADQKMVFSGGRQTGKSEIRKLNQSSLYGTFASNKDLHLKNLNNAELGSLAAGHISGKQPNRAERRKKSKTKLKPGQEYLNLRKR